MEYFGKTFGNLASDKLRFRFMVQLANRRVNQGPQSAFLNEGNKTKGQRVSILKLGVRACYPGEIVKFESNKWLGMH